MSKNQTEIIRSKIITIGEVFDVLNAHNVPFDVRAQLDILRRAKHRRTFKYVMNRTWAYTKAFFPALLFTIRQKWFAKGKYEK